MNKEFTIEEIEATMTYYGLIYIVDAIKKLRENEVMFDILEINGADVQGANKGKN